MQTNYPERMQQSVVSLVDGEGIQLLVDGSAVQLRLSGALSNWLFVSKFWDDFNDKHGTIFDQCEEDIADPAMVRAVVEALDERICGSREIKRDIIEFVYAWRVENNKPNTPLITSMSKESLLSELAALRDFLNDAATKNQCVEFSL